MHIVQRRPTAGRIFQSRPPRVACSRWGSPKRGQPTLEAEALRWVGLCRSTFVRHVARPRGSLSAQSLVLLQLARDRRGSVGCRCSVGFKHLPNRRCFGDAGREPALAGELSQLSI